jgi:hypothetical protein
MPPSARNGGGHFLRSVASDHHLVVAKLKFKLAANKLSGQRVTRKKFNTEKFNHGETRKKFEEEIKKSISRAQEWT